MSSPSKCKPAALAVSTGLRDARERRGLGVRELARSLGISPAVMSGLELGVYKPQPVIVARVLGCLQVRGAEYDQIMDLAAQVENSNLVDQSTSPLLNLLWTYERLASRIVEWAPFRIPDLLQGTPLSDASADDVLRPSERRDQEQFHRSVRLQAMHEGGRRYVFFIGEQAMRTARDDHGRADQRIELLHDADKLDHVTVRIVPSAWRESRLLDAFTLFESGTEPIAAALKHTHCTTFLTDRKLRTSYHRIAKALLRSEISGSVTVQAWLDSNQTRAS
jgi:transcriptional regulator with XRE-family HTH domain